MLNLNKNNDSGTNKPIKIGKSLLNRLTILFEEYNQKSKSSGNLLQILNEVELPESVYNSNAIENSTLTLDDTEKILLDMEISKNISLRELNEAQNLGKVMKYVEKKCIESDIEIEIILFLHKMLLNNINDDIAGRLRKGDEWVRVGKHVGADPKIVGLLVNNILFGYSSSAEHAIVKAAKFHREFELIHPFIDGNGRIGRVIINYMLMRAGWPPIIVRDKDKQDYYMTFKSDTGEKDFVRIVGLLMCESLHKRLAYMNHKNIITLDTYSKSDEYNKNKESASSLFNKAYRQTMPAFRERGVWKIGI
jgi:Fic family protein